MLASRPCASMKGPYHIAFSVQASTAMREA
jgi:hypothetical protein